MKNRITIILLILGVSVLCALSACSPQTQTVPAPTESPPSESMVLPIPDNAGAALTSPSFSLKLTANDSTAILNGGYISLSHSPFIRDGIFYLPLEDIVISLGGTYEFDANSETAKAFLFGREIAYSVSSTVVSVDGENYQRFEQRNRFEIPVVSEALPDGYGPIVEDGTVFIPSDLHDVNISDIGINAEQAFPDSKMVVLGRFTDERIVDGFSIDTIFADLSNDKKAIFGQQNMVDRVLNYEIVEYGSNGLYLYVMRKIDGTEDVEHMDGRICSTLVTEMGHPTLRGLEVGDSAFRAYQLHPSSGVEDFFSYYVDSSFVASFSYNSRYFTAPRYPHFPVQ